MACSRPAVAPPSLRANVRSASLPPVKPGGGSQRQTKRVGSGGVLGFVDDRRHGVDHDGLVCEAAEELERDRALVDVRGLAGRVDLEDVAVVLLEAPAQALFGFLAAQPGLP